MEKVKIKLFPVILLATCFSYLFHCSDETSLQEPEEKLEFSYVCPNGSPAEGVTNVKNTQLCQSCNEGWALNSSTSQCDGTSYSCENGIPKDGVPAFDGESLCKSCNAGFKLSDDQITCEEDPDDSQEKDPDDSQEKDPDDSQEEDPDDSQEKDPDDSQEEDPDDSQEEDPDDSQEEDPDDSQEEDPDDSQEEDPDDSQEEDPDDSQEEDHGNSREEAALITLNTTLLGDLYAPQDVDYFAVNITERGILRAYTTGAIDTEGRVEDETGLVITAVSDIAYVSDEAYNAGDYNRNFDLSAHILTPGTYYIRVGTFLGRTTSSYDGIRQGAYNLVVSFTAAGADDHGDSRDDATVVTIGSTTPTPGDIDLSGDKDYFAVTAPSSQSGVLIAHTEYTSDRTNTVGSIEDASGNELHFHDDIRDNYHDLDQNFRVFTTPTQGETYYIQVRGRRRRTLVNAGDYYHYTTGSYKLVVSFMEDHGDTRNDATTLSVDSSGEETLLDAALDSTSDIDYFTLTTPDTGTRFMLYAEAIETKYVYDRHTEDVNTTVILENSSGTELVSEDNKFLTSIESNEQYFVRVQGREDSVGLYKLKLSLRPINVLTLGTAITGSINSIDEIDYFSLNITSSAPGILRVYSTGIERLRGSLQDSRDNLIFYAPIKYDASSATTPPLSKAITSPAGEYLLAIDSSYRTRRPDLQSGFTSGSYELTVDFEPAVVITSGSTTTGSIDSARDEDVYAITVSQPGLFRFYTQGSTDILGTIEESYFVQIIGNDGGTDNNFDFLFPLLPNTYFIRVTGKNGSTGGYDLTASHTSIPTVNLEADALLTDTFRGQVEAEIDSANDVDYFLVTAPDDGTLTISTTGSTDTVGLLRSPTFREVGSDDNGGSDNNFSIFYFVRSLSRRSNFIRVAGKDGSTGAYTLDVVFEKL